MRGEFNFVWFFAIVAGIAILGLAIYGVMKFGNTESYKENIETAKRISILTNPLQAGYAKGSFGEIIFNQETRLKNRCINDSFGRNLFSVQTKIGSKFGEWSGEIPVRDKYIFSEKFLEGKRFYVFSSGFYFPFKIADLTFVTSKNYCFIDAPDFVKKELGGLNPPNVQFDNCNLTNPVKVCFGKNCNISVFGECNSCDSKYIYGRVDKGGVEMEYYGELIYGAIFSSKSVYECNFDRLMYRGKKLCDIYARKIDYMESSGCSSNLKGDLINFGKLLEKARAQGVFSLANYVEGLKKKEQNEVCKVWE